MNTTIRSLCGISNLNDLIDILKKLKILIGFSINDETIIKTDQIHIHKKGKIEIYSIRRDSNNNKCFWVRFSEGEEERKIVAQEIISDSIAGSSFNVATHLRFLGCHPHLCGFLRTDDHTGKKIQKYCRENGISLLPSFASNTGKTLIIIEKNDPETLILMEKPGKINPQEILKNNIILESQWDIIISTSLHKNKDLLLTTEEIFKKFPLAVKGIIPSKSLLSEKKLIDRLREITITSDIFQVNEQEAATLLLKNISDPFWNTQEIAAEVREKLSTKTTIITLGNHGSFISSDYKPLLQSAINPPEEIIATVGAGDAFHAGVMLILAITQKFKFPPDQALKLAVEFGSELASKVITINPANFSDQNPEKIKKVYSELQQKLLNKE